MDLSTTYLFIERRPERTVQSSLMLDGTLDVTVRLQRPAGSLSWRSRVTSDSVATCEQMIDSMAGRLETSSGEARYSVSKTSNRRKTEMASWNEVKDGSDLDRVRRTLESREHLRYFVASTYLKLAEVEKDEAVRGEAFKQGIMVLGSQYEDERVLDDTGMKLALAQSMERKDGLAKASPIYERVLKDRITIYADREGLVHPLAEPAF